MKTDMDFADVLKRYDEPIVALLIQALAIITVQEEFSDLTPEEVFDIVKRQAQAVADIQRE